MQRACLAELAAAAGLAPDELPVAVDGCGVPTWAMSLRRMARAFARLEELEGGDVVAAAMRAHPELIRGPRAADTMLMRELDGLDARRAGPRGCSARPGRTGSASRVKVEDGATRATRPAVAELLRRLGLETGDLGVVPLENSRGELVGEIVAER